MKHINLCKALLFIAVLFSIFSCRGDQHLPAGKYSVLFIAVDDLRPELGCYGRYHIHSPHIDELASTAFIFDRAYCQVPVCGASRASLLTGTLPTSERFLGYDARMDEDAPGLTTLPGHFKKQGYYTVNYGKVSHFPDDQEDSWSEAPLRPDWHKLPDGSWSWEGWHDYQEESNIHLDKNHPKKAGLAYEGPDVPDSAYADGRNIAMAIKKLKALKELDQPFFFGVGLLKPHLPFNAPKKYWDLYGAEDINLADNLFPPAGVPVEGIPNWGELRAYAGIPAEGPVQDSTAQKLIHGYYACISYVDALIGSLLDELRRLDLEKSTIVVLWSDHGYFTGEHGFWCKHALYELATRVPLIIKIPGLEKARRVNSIVELVDLYPTLCELNGLPLPDHLQGKSFTRAFREKDYQHRDFAYSRYFAGESILMDSCRYTAYFDEQNVLLSEMLFDHRRDPGENHNMASLEEYGSINAGCKSLIEDLRNQ